MTRRAARMLAALEDGCVTRSEIFAHQGRFSLLNNAAAELRAAGVTVDCVLVEGEYHYLLGQGGVSNGTPVPPPRASAVLVEETSGQIAWAA